MTTEILVQASARELRGKHRLLKALMAAHPFFDGLQPQHLALLADCAMQTEFAGGQVIFREEQPANRFYVVLEGAVALEARAPGSAPVLIDTIGAGEVLGWSWLFEPYAWHFTARAVEATKAIFFYGTWLRERCETERAFGCELYLRMASVVIERLQSARRRLLELSYPIDTASARIIRPNQHKPK